MVTNPELHLNSDQAAIYERFEGVYPFPVVEFATELGIDVYESEDLDPSASGILIKRGSKYCAFLNAKHSKKRRCFTLAHEIGHFICDQDFFENNSHLQDFSSPKYLPRDGSSNPTEARANRFAAALLMPESEFRRVLGEKNSVTEVADYFGVSEAAVSIRVKTLFGEEGLNITL